MFWGSSKGVSWKFQAIFKGVSWKFHGRRSFKDVLRVFHDFQGCFQSISRKFQWNLQGVSKSFILHDTHHSFLSRKRACFPLTGGGGGRRLVENYPFFFLNPSLGKAEQYFMAMTPPLTRWQMAIMSKSIRGAVNKETVYLNTSLAAPGALAHRLQRCTACNTSPPNLSKMADGVWKGV